MSPTFHNGTNEKLGTFGHQVKLSHITYYNATYSTDEVIPETGRGERLGDGWQPLLDLLNRRPQ